ncbi:MAG: hypothetical protein MZV70_67680 [Desulfobacterales bacterium]|nr:hypothetical protein [Desulfobacterales bacterium]
MPLGCIATNGVRRIDPGRSATRSTSPSGGTMRPASGCARPRDLLERQIENYARRSPGRVRLHLHPGEHRRGRRGVVDALAAADCRITFNMFSSPVGYTGRAAPRRGLAGPYPARRWWRCSTRHPGHVLFSPYSAVAHTHAHGPARPVRLFLSPDEPLHGHRPGPFLPPVPDRPHLGPRTRPAAFPTRIARDCRHYAAGSAVVTARLYRHVTDPADLPVLAGLRGHLSGASGSWDTKRGRTSRHLVARPEIG